MKPILKFKEKLIFHVLMKAPFVLTLFFALACAEAPQKAERLNTAMEKKEHLHQDDAIGVKNGYMIYQRKVFLSEELRLLQNTVYELEDRVYGTRKYGSLGLYGVLRDCHVQMSLPENGGDGHLVFLEPLDRVTDKEEDYRLGLDENGRLIGLSEEFLKARIDRFKGYKQVLQKREDEYREKILICDTKLKSKRKEAFTSLTN